MPKPPWVTSLKTRHPLHPAQMTHASVRARVSDLTLAISRQKLLLEDMQTQLENLQLQLDSIIYPVLTLPPEITSEIFVHCVPPVRSRDVVDPGAAPLLLLHVCRAWRQIAVSTPALWTTLTIEAPRLQPQFMEIVDTWLTRARQCPLSVKIVTPFTKIDDFDGFLETFSRHSGGMRSLELNLTVGDFDKMDGHRLAFPLLQTLSTRVVTWDGEVGMKVFEHVPMLREVWMHFAPPSFFTLPWHQLTKFTGEFFTIPECLEALRFMPNIVECCFAARPQQHEPTDLPLPYQNRSSEVWEIARSTDILGFLTLPNLQTLEILDPDPDDFDAHCFQSFLSRSAPPLRKLTVCREMTIPLAALLAVRGLTHLAIWHPSQVFIIMLFDSFGRDTSLVPQLQNLSFVGCIGEDWEASVSEIVNLAAQPITERNNNPGGFAPLQSFRVVYPLGTPVDLHLATMLAFQKLKAEGMDIHVGTEVQSLI
ncbi:hypothetical protein DFH09DRAFT_1211550 [Mycena vulgaris]|nr:hypothetical protein DFH09DRAFT_1211550 [Mycena vulgaris]